MSKLTLVEQQIALQESIVKEEIGKVKLSRLKKVSPDFALDILPITNPFELEVVGLASALVALDGSSEAIINAHNISQGNAVTVKNDASVNPDRWSQDPAKVELAEQALYKAEGDILMALTNEALTDIAAINQDIINKTSELALAVSKRDGWDTARASYKDISKAKPSISLEDAIESLKDYAGSNPSGEYDIMDIAKASGLSFRQAAQAIEHMLDVFAPTTLISTTYIR